MTTLYLTNDDLYPQKVNKPINKLNINDFFIVNIEVLMYATDIIFVDELTKVTHNIR